MEDRLQEVNNKIIELEQKRRELYLEISKLKKEQLEIKYGFKDGEIVLFKGKKAIVRLQDNSYWFTVALIKKDGDVSSSIRYVYSKSELLEVQND